jgi:2-dehydropantoate 2-reductase
MKILMFGRGAINTQYAYAFEKAGHTVDFYVRKGRKAEFGSSVALNIFDARKNIRGVKIQENWAITMIEDFTAERDYDLIFLSVQHYHIKNAIDFLVDRMGKATLLIFNNMWEEPKAAMAQLPENQLVWGFPAAGGGFDRAGVLNGSFFGTAKIGTFGNALTIRDKEVIALFKSAGIKATEQKDFRSWLFSHFVINAAMQLENLKYYQGNLLVENTQTTEYWRNVILNGKELLPLLKARDVDLKLSSDLKLLSLPPWLVRTLMNTSIEFLPSLKMVLTGHSNLFELQAYCQDVYSTAKEMNIPLPRYEMGSHATHF